jgi:hypothetical protein
LAKSTFCSADYSQISKTSAQAANIEAEYGLFSGGAGGSASESEIVTKQSQVCTSGFNSSAYSNQASDYARTVYQGSLDAWNRCQSLADRGLNFEMQSDPALQGVTVTLSAASTGTASTFLGLSQIGSGRSTCKTTLPGRAGSLSGQVITVDESTSFRFDSGSKLSIICERDMVSDGKNNLSADAQTLVFNTSTGAYQVPLAAIGRLSPVSVDQATAQIKAALSTDINRVNVDINNKLIGFIDPINVVIATAESIPVSNGGAPASGRQYSYPVSIPSGKKLISVWYIPIDNNPDQAGFNQIEAVILNSNTIGLNVSSAGRPALLRILIHAVYGPAT